jgi:two-component system response regulator AlgR
MTEQKLHILIADDEPLARSRLKRMIEKIPNCSVVAEAGNGQQAVEHAHQYKPDIAFLDIRMPEVDGLAAASQLSAMQPPPAIIFCTAYEEYALKAFQLHAIGYLLKPVREEELNAAIRQAKTLSLPQLKQVEQEINDEPPKSFIANTWQGQEILALNSIYYFRAEQKYISVIHEQGETLSTQTLKELEAEYEGLFVRAHRNTLVNSKHIKSLVRNHEGHSQIQLSNGNKVEVSRRHLSDVKAFIAQFS